VTQYRRWNIGPLGTGDRDLIRAQENERIVIDQIWITNKDTSNRTVDLHHLPADDGASTDDFCLIHGHTINSKTYEILDTKIYLDPGDRIVVHAGAANAIIVTAYGRTL
jgi:hypothetical protein